MGMPAPYLSPRHLFIAYAKMLATQNSSARVKDYHAMKYRLLTELFDANIASVDLQRLPRVMERDPKDFACRSISELYHLAESYSAESYYHPTNWEDHQEPCLEQLSSTRESLRQVRRLAARMRQVYASMAGELLKILNPGIGSRRIHVGRLAQLGLPAKPPRDDCDDTDADDDLPTSESYEDDIPSELLDGFKEREENLERARRQTAIEKAVIIERAIADGIGTAETLPGIIYEMDVMDFLKLTEEFPGLSRVDFKPHQDDEDFPF